MDQTIIDLGISEVNWQDALGSKERIKRLKSSNGELFWLKKSAPARGVFRYHALNLFSKLVSCFCTSAKSPGLVGKIS